LHFRHGFTKPGWTDHDRGVLAVQSRILAPDTALAHLLDVKNLIAALLLAFGLFCAESVRAESAWVTDYKKAQEEAKTSHKLVLLNFTGSDWCGFCFQLDKAILSQPQFKDYANKNLVLVEIDFPRRNGPRWNAQSIELKKQNAQLADKYDISGFPTLVILDGEGKTVWRYDGFYTGGIAAFLAELDKVRKG
jgi:protein disulfide-isomerase